MNIVAPGASFTLLFIPKEGSLDAATIRNKNTNVETVLVKDTSIVYFEQDYYYEADITYTVEEGVFYEITINDDLGNTVWVGETFCTAQSDYSIQDGQYTQHSTSNEYITR